MLKFLEFRHPSRFYPIPGRGARAHITLGTAGDAKPVQTGFDVLAAVEAEKVAEETGSTAEVPTFALGRAGRSVLRRYGKELWVLYPGRAAVFDALFTGHYS